MKLITNRISTGKEKRFEDFIADFKSKRNIKTASVKTAEEQEEADSSGQLDVEPLHQNGESTTMPKAGPSAKKDDGAKAAKADTDPEKEGKDSGQPKWEGQQKNVNDPEEPTEKGGSAKAKTKVAGHCSKCEETEEECTCGCKDCTAAKKVEVKIAGIKGNCSKCGKPNFLCKGKCSGDSDGDNDGSTEESEKKEDKKEEKDASSVKFVKVANLDPKNKSFLKDYWRQLFGDDYANAIIADK